ncbi:MAG: GNAT family N-acetyltransferase [Candidatus Spechtbacterales bacterium]
MNTFQKIENKNEWEDLLGRTLFKTFFHTPEWENFLEKNFSWLRFERYVWNGELLLSIARCRLFGKEKVVSHPFCEYGGPLPLKKGVVYSNFENDFIEKFGDSARMRFHPYIKVGSAGSLSTFWIDNYSRKTVDDLWRGIRKTLRQEIGVKDGQDVYIEDCKSEDELRQFYKIYLNTVRRHKNIPLTFAIFKFLYEGAVDADIQLAKYDGKVLGGSIFLFYQPFIHYFLSAADSRFRDKNIGHKILWYAMQKYVGREYNYFDLGGTRKGSALEVFKRGWGAKEFFIFGIGNNSDRGGVSSLRNILGFVPPGLMVRAAPFALWLKV